MDISQRSRNGIMMSPSNSNQMLSQQLTHANRNTNRPELDHLEDTNGSRFHLPNLGRTVSHKMTPVNDRRRSSSNMAAHNNNNLNTEEDRKMIDQLAKQ